MHADHVHAFVKKLETWLCSMSRLQSDSTGAFIANFNLVCDNAAQFVRLCHKLVCQFLIVWMPSDTDQSEPNLTYMHKT